jgi:hypothetical protein
MYASPTLSEVIAGTRTLQLDPKRCAKCWKIATDRKRYCGGCKVRIYCGPQCAIDDREEHKLACLSVHQDLVLAAEQWGAAQLTGVESYYKTRRNMLDWFSC